MHTAQDILLLVCALRFSLVNGLKYACGICNAAYPMTPILPGSAILLCSEQAFKRHRGMQRACSLASGGMYATFSSSACWEMGGRQGLAGVGSMYMLAHKCVVDTSSWVLREPGMRKQARRYYCMKYWALCIHVDNLCQVCFCSAETGHRQGILSPGCRVGASPSSYSLTSHVRGMTDGRLTMRRLMKCLTRPWTSSTCGRAPDPSHVSIACLAHPHPPQTETASWPLHCLQFCMLATEKLE